VKTKDSVKVSDLAQNYSFKFKLPAGSDQSAISAEMANGILKVVVKKNANRHQIEVK
jgi:HSP20 family molecular chaperone IbpA